MKMRKHLQNLIRLAVIHEPSWRFWEKEDEGEKPPVERNTRSRRQSKPIPTRLSSSEDKEEEMPEEEEEEEDNDVKSTVTDTDQKKRRGRPPKRKRVGKQPKSISTSHKKQEESPEEMKMAELPEEEKEEIIPEQVIKRRGRPPKKTSETCKVDKNAKSATRLPIQWSLLLPMASASINCVLNATLAQ